MQKKTHLYIHLLFQYKLFSFTHVIKESVLGCNCQIPLLHMSKRKAYIEITNERINEFSFAYMCNPHLYRHKVFKEQVKYV